MVSKTWKITKDGDLALFSKWICLLLKQNHTGTYLLCAKMGLNDCSWKSYLKTVLKKESWVCTHWNVFICLFSHRTLCATTGCTDVGRKESVSSVAGAALHGRDLRVLRPWQAPEVHESHHLNPGSVRHFPSKGLLPLGLLPLKWASWRGSDGKVSACAMWDSGSVPR